MKEERAMLIAVKKNRQLRIPDEKRKVYESLGYTIKDSKGKIISEPEDPKKEVEELKAEVATLKAEKEHLEEELAELKAPEAAEPEPGAEAVAEPVKKAAASARKKTTA